MRSIVWRSRWGMLLVLLVSFRVSTSASATLVLPPQAPAPQENAPTPKPPETYTYEPEGRRDPFVSLLSRGADGRGNGRRPSGLAGLSIGEIALRGIVRSEGSLVAIVQAPDNRTFLVHTGDRFFDGSVKAITADAVIFLQEVNDPLSLVKQREVRKPLRAEVDER